MVKGVIFQISNVLPNSRNVHCEMLLIHVQCFRVVVCMIVQGLWEMILIRKEGSSSIHLFHVESTTPGLCLVVGSAGTEEMQFTAKMYEIST